MVVCEFLGIKPEFQIVRANWFYKVDPSRLGQIWKSLM
jgi:hypothetical protein